jgi:hypothetical protein
MPAARAAVFDLPMTAAATPVSAAAEQQHDHNDNQNQFHRISPLTARTSIAAHLGINGVFKAWFPIGV